MAKNRTRNDWIVYHLTGEETDPSLQPDCAVAYGAERRNTRDEHGKLAKTPLSSCVLALPPSSDSLLESCESWLGVIITRGAWGHERAEIRS